MDGVRDETDCHGVPWLVRGPVVDSGAVHDTLLLEDVAPTVPAILGVALPWAEGVLVMGEV